MTTREAFTELVNSPYLWDKTGETKENRRIHKHRIEKNQWPTLDKMEALLEKSGQFAVVQEKKWGMSH